MAHNRIFSLNNGLDMGFEEDSSLDMESSL